RFTQRSGRGKSIPITLRGAFRHAKSQFVPTGMFISLADTCRSPLPLHPFFWMGPHLQGFCALAVVDRPHTSRMPRTQATKGLVDVLSMLSPPTFFVDYRYGNDSGVNSPLLQSDRFNVNLAGTAVALI